MNPERAQFLNLKHRPARLNAEEAAWYLGFQSHEIPILVAAKLLRPLGNPALNGCKYFAAEELDRLRIDASWLAKASDVIVKYWRGKNSRKSVNRGRLFAKELPRNCASQSNA
jgi:hypothetical protein